MKFIKKLAVILAIAALTLSFTSCDAFLGILGVTTPGAEKEAACQTLGNLMVKSYDDIKLEVTTTEGGLSLKSEFRFVDNKVIYSIEKFSKFEITDGGIKAPEKDKEIISGEAMLNGDDGDRNVMLDGELIDVKNYATLVGGFNFSPDNLADFVISGNSVSFAVNNPSLFFGTNVEAGNMKVTIDFDEVAVKTISIRYNAGTTVVKLDYTFTAK